MSEKSQVPLQQKLNLETAPIAWRDLQTFFASGAVIYVATTQDMLLVAEQLAADNAPLVKEWMEQGLVGQVTDEQALRWYEQDATLWSVVIKPWVLVQERD